MKSFLSSVAVLAMLACVVSTEQLCFSKEKMAEAFKICKTKENITSETEKALLNREVPETMDGKCFLACWFEQLHLCSQSGKMDVGSCDKVCDAVCTADNARGEQLRAAVEKCRPEGDKATGEESTLRCERAYHIAKCVHEEIANIWDKDYKTGKKENA
ncbi:hypothetical protein R5R35_010598 [Gryllus longicercus]|uniref:Odorant binding protein n=1 Tax=Gryllus longicercus TaxID=2509291 RepID=A0AAN9VLL8_9ORTH